MGDEVTVRVAAVKPEESAIDFELVGMKKTFHRPRRESPKVIHAKQGKQGGSRKPRVKPVSQEGKEKRNIQIIRKSFMKVLQKIQKEEPRKRK